MMAIRATLATLLTVVPMAASAQDAPAAASASMQSQQRACLPEDLIGHTYKMVAFRETPERREAQWHQRFPYQYLTFKPQNFYGTVATNVEVKTRKVLDVYLGPRHGHLMQYTLNGGVLTLLDNEMIRYTFRCTAVLKDISGYIKGDIIVNGYTRKAKSELYKLYRRWY